MMVVVAAAAAPKLSMGENLVMLNIQQPSCYQVAGEWIQKDLIECTNSLTAQKQFVTQNIRKYVLEQIRKQN